MTRFLSFAFCGPLRAALPRLLILCGVMLSATGCGFHPLYGSPASSALLSNVKIDNIEGETGQKLRLMLMDRFYGRAPMATTPAWHLSVTLKTAKEELGIRRDDVATRSRLRVLATFKLSPTDPVLADKTKPFEGQERSFVSYNILTDPYATTAAEDNALERGQTQIATQLATRIALYLEGKNVEGTIEP